MGDSVVITGSLGVGGVLSLGWIDLRFCRIWRSCPFTVAVDFGRCFFTSSAVSPGHEVKKPVSISSIQVDGTGLKDALCR